METRGIVSEVVDAATARRAGVYLKPTSLPLAAQWTPPEVDSYVGRIICAVWQFDVVSFLPNREVLVELQRRGQPFALVYPERSLKDEYIERARRSESFLRGVDDHSALLTHESWDDLLTDTSTVEWGLCPHYVLGSGERLDGTLLEKITTEWPSTTLSRAQW